MAPPAAERRAGIFVLNCAPEPPGALELTAFGRRSGEDADAEDAARAIAELVGDHKRLTRARLAVLEEPGIEGEAGQLRERSALPPRHSHFARQRRAFADQLKRAPLVTLVAGDCAECSGGLRPAPTVVRPFVDFMTRLHELARTLELAAPRRLNPQPVEEDGAPVLVSELLEKVETLPVQLHRCVVVAGDVR